MLIAINQVNWGETETNTYFYTRYLNFKKNLTYFFKLSFSIPVWVNLPSPHFTESE